MRVKLDLTAFGLERLEWMLIDPGKTPTVEDVARQIAAKKAAVISTPVEIHMEGCLLPEEEAVDILQNGDVVTVVEKKCLLPPPCKKIKLEPGLARKEVSSSSSDSSSDEEEEVRKEPVVLSSSSSSSSEKSLAIVKQDKTNKTADRPSVSEKSGDKQLTKTNQSHATKSIPANDSSSSSSEEESQGSTKQKKQEPTTPSAKKKRRRRGKRKQKNKNKLPVEEQPTFEEQKEPPPPQPDIVPEESQVYYQEEARVCKFHLRGACKRGTMCQFKHLFDHVPSAVLSTPPPVPATPIPTTATPNVSDTSSNQLTPDKAKQKCKSFLTTLLRLTSKKQTAEVAANLQALIQDLIDGKVEPEPFTAQLQMILNSSPQLSLVPFIEQSLPHLRQSLASGEMSIKGIRAPSVEGESKKQLNEMREDIRTQQPLLPAAQIETPSNLQKIAERYNKSAETKKDSFPTKAEETKKASYAPSFPSVTCEEEILGIPTIIAAPAPSNGVKNGHTAAKKIAPAVQPTSLIQKDDSSVESRVQSGSASPSGGASQNYSGLENLLKLASSPAGRPLKGSRSDVAPSSKLAPDFIQNLPEACWDQIEPEMTLAFKMLEMSASYQPQISDFKFGRVTEVNRGSSELTIEVERNEKDEDVPRGRFEVSDESGDDEGPNVLSLKWSDLILPRLKL